MYTARFFDKTNEGYQFSGEGGWFSLHFFCVNYYVYNLILMNSRTRGSLDIVKNYEARMRASIVRKKIDCSNALKGNRPLVSEQV